VKPRTIARQVGTKTILEIYKMRTNYDSITPPSSYTQISKDKKHIFAESLF
jgi:hypothetical protein